MNNILVIGLSILIIQQSVAPPVNTKEKHDEHEGPNDVLNELEYKRYAQEVMNILESDPVFTARVNASTTDDIKSGKIADELEFLSHHVRNKLDEAKRAEISRLTEAINRLNTLSDSQRERVLMPKHLDHGNLHTFEKDDLKKLITQLHKDIEAYDEQRKKQFKEYEMEKKFERELKMKGLNETELEKLKYEYAAQEEKHKKHEPLHHPGSKQQLEEVWEKEDHMEGQDFNPKTFFYMHDIDGNGFWDPQEVNALFEKELDKLYQEGHPEDDLIERAEEMERMREHFMKEADTNNDSLISLHEYLEITKSPKFEKDEGWESIDQQKIYTEEEYHEFERRRQEELARQQAQYGHGQVQHPGMSQQVPYHGQPMQHQQNPQYQQHQMPQYQQIPQHQMPQYQQAPHNQMPQYQQPPHNQMPQYQQVPHNNQMPQYQQVPQQYQQVPHNDQQQQYQQYQQQHPQQQHPQQQPIQGQVNQDQQQVQVNQQQQQQQGQVNQQQQGQVNQQQQQGQVNQQQQAQVNQQQQQQHNPEPQQAQQAQQNLPVAQGTGNLPNSIPDVKKV